MGLRKRNILIVYYTDVFPLRATILEHLYSFRRFSGENCYYLNVASPGLPRSLRDFEPDLIVFHTIFLSRRMAPETFSRMVEKVRFLAASPAKKAMLPQDEHVRGDLLCSFIKDFGIQYVFSCAQQHDWATLYPEVDDSLDVRFSTVLAGYLSEDSLVRIERIAARSRTRDIDIGYRAWSAWPSLGRHGQLKPLIGELVAERAEDRNLNTDISCRIEDTFLGDDWYAFLLRCKYVLGVEGGSSILDYDGSLEACTRAYLKECPDADFEQVEAACFPGRDGEVSYFAISPRHLEACATRTCQVLVEGDYSGVLTPGLHYVELKADFSNLDDVLDRIEDDDARSAITTRAFEDVVASGRWTYEGFVDTVLESMADDVGTQVPPAAASRSQRAACFRGNAWDRYWWWRRIVKYRARTTAVRVLGEERVLSLMSRVRRTLGAAKQ